MLFKNLQIYSFPADYRPTKAEVNYALGNIQSRQPGAQETATYGFVPPIDAIYAEYLPNDALVVCAEKIEKIIPAAAVKDILKLKVKDVEQKENRKVSKKELSGLKDEIIFEILPTALTKSSRTYAYLDFRTNVIVVDAASPKKAEDLLSALRKALGSFPVVPIQSAVYPETLMTEWVANSESINAAFTVEQELQLNGEEGGKITIRDRDPESDDVRAHVDSGMKVTKLGLTFNDRLSLVLTDDLQIKKLKFLELVQAELIGRLDECEDPVSAFIATATIQVGEIRKLIEALDEEIAFKIPEPEEELA